MASRLFLKLSGAALAAAGLAYFIDTALDFAAPAQNPGVGGFVPLLGLIGFPGFWLTLKRDNEALAGLAFLLTMAGLAGLMVVTFLMNFLFPSLMGEEIGRIVALVGPYLAAVGVTFLLSALVLCAVTWRAGGQVRLAGVIYLLGAIPVSLPPLMPDYMEEVGALAVGTGLLIWGARVLALKVQPQLA